MKQMLLVFAFLCLSMYAPATITTNFYVNNVIEDKNQTVSLHSFETLENGALVTIKIVPKEDIQRLTFWTSENTVIEIGEEELPIAGFKIDTVDGANIFSTEPFNGKWGWSNAKKGNSYYYTMAFDGEVPPGIFKMSLIDKGTENGSHGYVFRNIIINNKTLHKYDFKSEPLKTEYFPESKKIESGDNSYVGSLHSVKIYDNYTTVTVRLIPNKNLESLPFHQSENTVLDAGYYTLPIQGFLGDFNENGDTTLYSMPFNGAWYWKNAEVGKDYYYTMVFDGKIRQGIESISIIDEGCEKRWRGLSFRNVKIDNPVPFNWNRLDEYFSYQYRRAKDYILNQPFILSAFYITLLAFLAICPLVFIFRICVIRIGNILLRYQEKRRKEQKPRKQNLNRILRERDQQFMIQVLVHEGQTTKYVPVKLTEKTRVLNSRIIHYYSSGEFLSTVYLHPGDYLYKVVLSFIEIKERCKSSSIKKAFSDCPALLDKLNRFVKGQNPDWVYVKWKDGAETICHRNNFIVYEKGAYLRGINSLKIIAGDVPKIKTSLLKKKLTLEDGIKKGIIWVIRAGAKILAATVAGYAGASLPDFDFDFDFDIGTDVPDIDISGIGELDVPDFDDIYDYSTDTSDCQLDDNLNASNNISFQGSSDYITVHEVGNSSNTKVLEVKKVAGTSHQWNVFDGSKKIATIDSLINAYFYLPGTGNVKI